MATKDKRDLYRTALLSRDLVTGTKVDRNLRVLVPADGVVRVEHLGDDNYNVFLGMRDAQPICQLHKHDLRAFCL